MNWRPVRVVFWDHDGTIVDSLPKHYQALAEVFKRAGAAIPPLETMCHWWYMPAMDRFRALGVNTPENEIWPLYDRIIGQRMFPIFEGIKETLAGLSRRNIPNFVLTATPYSDQVLACLGKHRLLPYISDLSCGQESKKEAIIDILDRLSISSQDAIFVGDMISDILDAQAANVRAIVFDGGYGGEYVLAATKAETLIQTPTEIFRLVDSLD